MVRSLDSFHKRVRDGNLTQNIIRSIIITGKPKSSIVAGETSSLLYPVLS